MSSSSCADGGTAAETEEFRGEWGMQERVLLMTRRLQRLTGPLLALLAVLEDLGQEQRNLSYEGAQRYWDIEKQPRIQERPMRGGPITYFYVVLCFVFLL